MQFESNLSLTAELLVSQLTEFGLNPKQWQVQVIDDVRAEVISREDQDLSFHGAWDSKQKTWRTLELSEF